ncbi:MAG: F0F1 ATP synthase subunit delta [Desulfobacteraceae bacterium]|nr:F0F1 ATP synthase subunit delta [Desulfobacteraceae bacterium]
MLIDWFTVIAQAINFLILVWLMKRLLYKPILHAIDAREKRVAAELADAGSKKAEAQRERDEFRRKNEEFDRQRAALLSKAIDEVKAERRRLLDEARKESDNLRARHISALQGEYQGLSDEITRRILEEVLATARKTLADLAATDLEEQIAMVFINRLRVLSDEEKERLKSAFKTRSGPAVVRSAFELTATQQNAIELAVREILAFDAGIMFETAPELIGGIEFTANGQKLAWSIADYLKSLDKGVGDLLKTRYVPETGTGPGQTTEANGG